MNKTCNRCNVAKPLEEFYKHPKQANGRMGTCKDCHRAAVQVRYIDKMKDEDWREGELFRQRVKTAKTRSDGRTSNKEIIRRSRKAWQERNEEKRRAHNAVSNAVRDGRLEKKPCEICGNPDSQGHHEDYSKPLDVRWLCVRHHADRHLELNRERRAEKYRKAS